MSEIDWDKHIGEKVIDKDTGEIKTILSYSPRPSVTLSDENGDRENWIGFCVGSPISKDWELYKEPTTSGELFYTNPESTYGDIPLKDNGTHDITFNTKDCNSIIELKENGDIFVKGKLIENDKEVVDGMRELLGFTKIKKESLSDKLRTPFGFDGDWAKAEDIRKAICKFLRESKKITNCKYDFYWLAKEIFGKQLT